MPGARLTLNDPAASAAPVPPAHTSACALPSATARAACTIEASRVVRAAPTGSGLLAIDTGASTTSTPAGTSPSSCAGPNRITRTPPLAAIAAPAATSDGPMSAPLQSTATTGACGSSAGTGEELLAGDTSPGDTSPLLLLVLVLVGVRPGGHDLAAGIGAAHRAHAVRPARAVALRTRVDRGRADLVLGAALGGTAVGLLFLGDCHREQKATSPIDHYSSFSSESFAQRGSGALSWWWPGGASFRSTAHTGQSPAQSSRQSTFTGAARANASRAHAARSSVSSCMYGLCSSSPSPGRSTSLLSTSTTGAACVRQRMHGPSSAAWKRSRSA